MNGSESWRLWNLRALKPEATTTSLKRIETQRKELALDGNHHVSPDGIIKITKEAKQFVSNHPELKTGITVTMHMVLYALLL